MRSELARAYVEALFKHGRALVSGALAGVLGFVVMIHPFIVPAWVWFTVAGVFLWAVQFLAFRDVWLQLEAAQDVSRVSKVLGTELRDIRHKIELVRATRPNSYSQEFELPFARWDEGASKLAASPELYEVVESAYTAARHVVDTFRIRRSRADFGVTIGVHQEDGLDEAYELAGKALDALGEPRGTPWESASARAVREVTEDLMHEEHPVTLPSEHESRYQWPGELIEREQQDD